MRHVIVDHHFGCFGRREAWTRCKRRQQARLPNRHRGWRANRRGSARGGSARRGCASSESRAHGRAGAPCGLRGPPAESADPPARGGLFSLVARGPARGPPGSSAASGGAGNDAEAHQPKNARRRRRSFAAAESFLLVSACHAQRLLRLRRRHRPRRSSGEQKNHHRLALATALGSALARAGLASESAGHSSASSASA